MKSLIYVLSICLLANNSFATESHEDYEQEQERLQSKRVEEDILSKKRQEARLEQKRVEEHIFSNQQEDARIEEKRVNDEIIRKKINDDIIRRQQEDRRRNH